MSKSSKAVPTLEVGSKVRVLTGPFAGRIGEILELDPKGEARVGFGPMQARVPASELRPAIEPRVRPTLKSSHFHRAAAAEAPDSKRPHRMVPPPKSTRPPADK